MGQEAGAINLIYRMMQEAILCLVLKEPLLLTFCRAVLTEISNPRPHSRRRSPLRYRGEAGGRPHLVSRSNCEAESRRRRSRSIGKPGKYIQTGGKHRGLHTFWPHFSLALFSGLRVRGWGWGNGSVCLGQKSTNALPFIFLKLGSLTGLEAC